MRKRTEKSKANSRQKSKANSKQKSTANCRQEKRIANSGQSKPKDCDRDKAKCEEKHSAKESSSQPVPDVQQGQYELKLGEVIPTIPAINFNEENANCSDSSEAAAQKVQKIVLVSLSLKQMFAGSQPSS